ncbi:TPA: excinuclease ABC subunit C [Candidatus Kaiserbacteria bacterium]|nr:excinuclease ABC subunit C [Candidatus Kaiserbacteria bacterium]
MHYIYILQDESAKIYVGYTNDLRRRVGHHKHGEVNTTKAYNNPTLVWYCAFKSKKRALEFERYLKRGSGHAFMRKHLLHTYEN